MTAKTASRPEIRLARLAVVVIAVLCGLGIVWYGISAEVHGRIWRDIAERPGGPMTFRFLLQPCMAAIAALHDGIKDARLGRTPYLWTVVANRAERAGRLREGLIATARIILLGLGMDAIYQATVLKTFYPGEMVIVAQPARLRALSPAARADRPHRALVVGAEVRRFVRGQSMAATDHAVTSVSYPDRISVELSSRRTGMSFQRTRMSADRTLMSVIRTSLSLISFGFTIFQVFEKLRDAGTLTHAGAARNFGVTLVALGILMLVGGIAYHLQFMVGLREERKAMVAAGLVHGESRFPVSLTLITAIILLLVGVAAIVSMVFASARSDEAGMAKRSIAKQNFGLGQAAEQGQRHQPRGERAWRKPANPTSSSSGATTSASRTSVATRTG